MELPRLATSLLGRRRSSLTLVVPEDGGEAFEKLSAAVASVIRLVRGCGMRRRKERRKRGRVWQGT